MIKWTPAVTTDPVREDPDDPAIWIHPTNPELSLVVVTSKAASPNGAIVVYDLEGKIVQAIAGLDRPNNVDIRQSILGSVGAAPLDIAVVAERFRHAIRLFRIEAQSRQLIEMSPPGGLRVFEGEMGEAAEPMGIALYHRPTDGACFAIVGRKSGPPENYLWQYLLNRESEERVSAQLVRKFGRYSGKKEIESIAVDDSLGYVYYSDELAGVRKYYADPDNPNADTELSFFGRTGYRGEHEGIAIYQTDAAKGYLISTDQSEEGSRYWVYRREGANGNPHDHSEVLAIIDGGAKITDGIEVTSASLGPRFPKGMLAAMNSSSGITGNFLFFQWLGVQERPK
jgi:3-phytase